MTDFKKRPPYMELCLCRRCADVYFNDPAYWVERSNPIQTVRELCDVCSQYLHDVTCKLVTEGFARL